MRFKVQIFIPNNTLYKEVTIEAENILEAKQLANVIFKEEFDISGQKSGNFVIEQI